MIHRTYLCALTYLLVGSVGGSPSRVRRQNEGFWWLTPQPSAEGTTPSYSSGPTPSYSSGPTPSYSSGPPSLVSSGTPLDLAELAALFESAASSASIAGECECVPYYQCVDGSIITDGTGIIDIRSDSLPPLTIRSLYLVNLYDSFNAQPLIYFLMKFPINVSNLALLCWFCLYLLY